jgi:hypothetical protein
MGRVERVGAGAGVGVVTERLATAKQQHKQKQKQRVTARTPTAAGLLGEWVAPRWLVNNTTPSGAQRKKRKKQPSHSWVHVDVLE